MYLEGLQDEGGSVLSGTPATLPSCAAVPIIVHDFGRCLTNWHLWAELESDSTGPGRAEPDEVVHDQLVKRSFTV